MRKSQDVHPYPQIDDWLFLADMVAGHSMHPYTSPYFQVVRALMILLAAEGRSNDEIAALNQSTW